MKVAIHQSQYLPWPPYLKKMAAVDAFVVMDSVQYQKNGVQNRNQIRDKNQAFWLTVPVTGHLQDEIKDKKLVDDRWREKHRRSIEGAYSKAPFWAEFSSGLLALYERPYATLGEVNAAFLGFLVDRLGIKTRLVNLSELGVCGAKSELVLAACKALKADVYVSGTGSKDYLDEAAFARGGVSIDFRESAPPAYAQFHGGTFLPGLSSIDMMLNVGTEGMRAYLEAGR